MLQALCCEWWETNQAMCVLFLIFHSLLSTQLPVWRIVGKIHEIRANKWLVFRFYKNHLHQELGPYPWRPSTRLRRWIPTPLTPVASHFDAFGIEARMPIVAFGIWPILMSVKINTLPIITVTKIKTVCRPIVETNLAWNIIQPQVRFMVKKNVLTFVL